MRLVSALVIATLLAAISSAAWAKTLITIDKSTQRMTVVRDGEVLYNWPVSTGRSGRATPSGSFTAFRMEADHYSKEWDDAPMPHSIFFTKIGHAIHGSLDVKKLGTPASHGCIRLSPANAETLFTIVKEDGLTNTKVVVSGSEQIALARIKPAAKSRNEIRRAAIPPKRYAGHQYVQPDYRQRYYVVPTYYGYQYFVPAYAFVQPQYAAPNYSQTYFRRP
jgi:hypothetical protein